jgi:hypothetical protein
MSIRIVKLSSGYEVKVRPVPPHASVAVMEQYEYPDAPTEKVQSAAGHTEELPAPKDSSEMKVYQAECNRIYKESKKAAKDFLLDYAVIAWRDSGESDPINGEWQYEPSQVWELDPVLIRHGVKPSDNRRVDFIRYELITDNADLDLIYGMRLSVTPEAAIKAAEAQFPGDGADGKAIAQPAAKRGGHKG